MWMKFCQLLCHQRVLEFQRNSTIVTYVIIVRVTWKSGRVVEVIKFEVYAVLHAVRRLAKSNAMALKPNAELHSFM